MVWTHIEGGWFDMPSHMAKEAAKEAANALVHKLLESSGCEIEGSGAESTSAYVCACHRKVCMRAVSARTRRHSLFRSRNTMS